MAQVAPEQHEMKSCPDQADLRPQPKIPGNGCCCACCGGGPGDIKVENTDGGSHFATSNAPQNAQKDHSKHPPKHPTNIATKPPQTPLKSH